MSNALNTMTRNWFALKTFAYA